MQDINYLSPHFQLREFTESATARRYGIVNKPPAEAVENLRALCVNTLEPLREALGLPIIITSGYRCRALNDKIGHHSDRSQHMKGCAADFYVSSAGFRFQVSGFKSEPSRRELLIKAFREILTNPKIDYDQLILYPNFIHVSYVSKERNRHNILKARSDGKLGYGKLSYANALQLNY